MPTATAVCTEPRLARADGDRIRLADGSDWHFSAVPNAPLNVRSWGQTGKHLLGLSFTGSDPQRTSAA